MNVKEPSHELGFALHANSVTAQLEQDGIGGEVGCLSPVFFGILFILLCPFRVDLQFKLAYIGMVSERRNGSAANWERSEQTAGLGGEFESGRQGGRGLGKGVESEKSEKGWRRSGSTTGDDCAVTAATTTIIETKNLPQPRRAFLLCTLLSSCKANVRDGHGSVLCGVRAAAHAAHDQRTQPAKHDSGAYGHQQGPDENSSGFRCFSASRRACCSRWQRI